jgi:centromeric protein E
MQLYNEEVNDLLSTDSTKLQIHESKESGIYVAGLREDIVTSVEHVLQLLEEGERSRHVGETRMNKNSSRSHSIFRMVRSHLNTNADSLDSPPCSNLLS